MTAWNWSSPIWPVSEPSFHFTSCPSRRMPALLTRTSTRPHSATTASTAWLTWAESATSTLRKAAVPPAASRSDTRPSAWASDTSHAETRAPSCANRNAVARPIPAAAPVTMTTLPFNPVSMLTTCSPVSSGAYEPPPPQIQRNAAGRLVVADSRPDEHHEVSGLDSTRREGVVERHRDARRSGVAPLLHDGVRAVEREAEVGHHQLDRGLSDLGEDDEVDVADGEAALAGELADQPRPTLVVDLRGIPLDQRHLRPRSNRIFCEGRFVKYPFENELSALPERERDWCLNSFLDNPYAGYRPRACSASSTRSSARASPAPTSNRTTARSGSSSRVSWTCRWSSEFPNRPPKDILASARGKATEGYLHQLYFSYPERGGTESVVKSLQTKCGERLTVHANCPVERVIKRSDGTFDVTAGGSTRRFERIVSAMPLHELLPRIEPAPPAEVIAALRAMRYNSIHITVLNTEDDRLGDHFAVMVPPAGHHLSSHLEARFLGPSYHRPGTATLMPKRPFAAATASNLPAQQISEMVAGDLEKVGFSSAAAIRHCETRTFPYAYVIYDLDHRRNTDLVLKWLASFGITSFGRFGAFEYINTDEAVRRARETAHAFATSK